MPAAASLTPGRVVSHNCLYKFQQLQSRMDLWIQPCAQCAELYGKPSAEPGHPDLTLNGVGSANDERLEEHYTCVRCRGVFARILAGPPAKQIWMLLNAGQH